MRISDWSSDVCSSDLRQPPGALCCISPRVCWSLIGNPAIEQRVCQSLVNRFGRFLNPVTQIGDFAGDYQGCGAVEQNCVAIGAMLAQQQLPRSEEHTSELQSLMRISYAVFCLKKKNK